MAKYSEQFKAEATNSLFLLKSNGMVEIGEVECYNVRELVKELGISSYTLYQWNGKRIIAEEREETETEVNNFVVESTVIKKEVKRIEFGIDFWMHVARNMGLKNYRMNLNQLKLRIGNELIKSTGLVSNGVIEELKL